MGVWVSIFLKLWSLLVARSPSISSTIIAESIRYVSRPITRIRQCPRSAHATINRTTDRRTSQGFPRRYSQEMREPHNAKSGHNRVHTIKQIGKTDKQKDRKSECKIHTVNNIVGHDGSRVTLLCSCGVPSRWSAAGSGRGPSLFAALHRFTHKMTWENNYLDNCIV